MVTTALAVLGTLLGATVTGVFPHLAAGRTERTAARARAGQDALDAVADLAAADSAHRRALWLRGEAKCSGAGTETGTGPRAAGLRAASSATRLAVKRPYARVRLPLPHPRVKAAADAMITATYGMRKAATLRERETAQERARAAHDRFVDTAAEFFGTGL
ncbi:hypothetical protein ACQYWQ_10520 [Streptomyces sp. P6-2-1]|uniref:hypothetical protein n=1 Tax=Streptomyces sp. P6-2-1 TaxID=3422591 RepID=UPI003D36E431